MKRAKQKSARIRARYKRMLYLLHHTRITIIGTEFP